MHKSDISVLPVVGIASYETESRLTIDFLVLFEIPFQNGFLHPFIGEKRSLLFAQLWFAYTFLHAIVRLNNFKLSDKNKSCPYGICFSAKCLAFCDEKHFFNEDIIVSKCMQ